MNRKTKAIIISVVLLVSGVIITFIISAKDKYIQDYVEDVNEPLDDSNIYEEVVNVSPTPNAGVVTTDAITTPSTPPNEEINTYEPQEMPTATPYVDKYRDKDNPPKTLGDIKRITSGMSREEVESMFGLPNTFYGSGVAYPAYYFEDGRLLVFDYYPDGVSKLGIINEETNEVELLIGED